MVNGLWSQFLATNILHMRMRVGHLSLSNMQIAIRQQHEEDEALVLHTYSQLGPSAPKCMHMAPSSLSRARPMKLKICTCSKFIINSTIVLLYFEELRLRDFQYAHDRN